MDLITIFRRFPDQQACIEHPEAIRWGDDPHYPKCGSTHVTRKCDGDRVGCWNCHDCHASFNVLSGTVFEKSRMPLQKWFLVIGLMVNAKKSLSSYQLARDVELTPQTALYMQQRIRAAIAADQAPLLHGIVEADETCVGGKPRKGRKRDDDGPGAPHSRSTRKMPVLGSVERGGSVTARVANDLTGKGILCFIKETVDPRGSLLTTDEYRAYRVVPGYVSHAVINHSVACADGETHTNIIEGFWALLKRAWYGSHHHYSRKLASLFIAEAAWKYNRRDDDNDLASFLWGAVA